jgi:hypothetical protein
MGHADPGGSSGFAHQARCGLMGRGGWGAGISVADVDAFVHRYATPVLRTAGYRRNRRKYMIDGPRGRRALVEFDPVVDAHRTSFQVSYGVFTSAHEQFGEDKGFPPHPWPYTSFALLSTHLLSPEVARTGVRVPDHVFPQDWLLGDDEDHNAAVGAALVSGLESEILPQIESWFDPEALVRSLENLAPGAFPGLSQG